MGRGSCNPNLESQLLQGNSVRDRKSESNYVISSMNTPNNYPVADLKQKKIVEDNFDGRWKSGLNTRVAGGDAYTSNNR